jgi:hypothetical protein
MNTFSYLDASENVGIPLPQPHAGLYAPDAPHNKSKWSKNYSGPRIEPDSVSYAKEFYIQSHIPTNIRPGNNTIQNNPYKFNDPKYNSMCYAPSLLS